MRFLKRACLFTILIGVVALSLNTILGNATVTFIEKHNVQTNAYNFYYWKFNFWDYISNIKLAATNISVLKFEIPQDEWKWIHNATDLWVIPYDMGILVNWLILFINIALYPIKISAYLLQNVLAILGINIQNVEGNGLYWLIYFINNILGNFAIPYIPLQG